MTKKIIVSRDELPDINAYTRQYEIRYRITNEERSRFSHWTPIFSVSTGILYEAGRLELRGQLKLEKIGSSYVGITWDQVSLYKKVGDNLILLGELRDYDVWTRWAANAGATPSEWEHRGRVASTSLNINIPATYPYTNPSTGVVSNIVPKQLYVEIFRPTRPIVRFEETRSFPQNSTTVDITNDYFVFEGGHGTATGTPGLYLSTTPVGGLSNNVTYYTRTIDFDRISLHPNKSDALTNSNKINLTGTPSGTGSFTGSTFMMYNESITNL